jgi:peroxiredoxin
MAPTRQEYGIAIPMLTDPDHRVSETYGVLEWAVASGEPGHTFVLVGADGRIAWIQDYGAPQNRGVMYVDPEEIAAELEQALD